MKKKFLTGCLALLTGGFCAFAQDSSAVVTRAVVIDGDTLPMMVLPEVNVYGPIVFVSKLEALRYSRLVINVKRAYPYARIVSYKVKDYNEMIAKASSRKEKRRLMKKAEADLKAQFENDVKNMTEEQGEILIKLIDRETGSSSYDLIKEFRGGLVAVFYQSFGRLFGYNLKSTYDPEGADREIEQIVLLIESGEL